MKNCILLIIDSLNYSYVKKSNINLMPYMRQLENENISCENMFSQAPYTEAAVMNLYCGQNVLDNGGYLFRFKNTPTTLFEELKKSGYETYFNSYQPQCHPSSVQRGVDNLYYNVGYDQGALWSYRFSHYAQVKREKGLNEKDYNILYELLDDNFTQWLAFIDKYLTKDISINLIQDNSTSYNANNIRKEVEKEFKNFKNGKKNYVDDLLSLGMAHNFFKIAAFVQDHKVKNRENMNAIYNELTPLFKRIKKVHLKQNLRNAFWKIVKNPFKKIGTFICHPNKFNAKELAKSLYYSLNYLFDLDLNKRHKTNYDYYKCAPSARTHINHYIEWVKQRNNNVPHFACIHVDDIHNPEVFFTYDSGDIDVIRNDIKEAEDVLNQIPHDYYGGVTHDLSLRYADSTIKYLFEQLKENNLYDDTYVAICADHGFSFSGNPIRDSFVTNLYLENYNMPFLLCGNDLGHKRITKLCASKDIPATICSLLTENVPIQFTGHDVRDDTFEYPLLEIEYCGGGCPDISRRLLKIAAYDKDYFVGTLGKIENFNDTIITEIYDLKEDPLQRKNLIKKEYDIQKVNMLFDYIKQRKNSIIESFPESMGYINIGRS